MARVATLWFCDVDMHPPARLSCKCEGRREPQAAAQFRRIAVQAPEMDRTPPGVHMPINIRDLVSESISRVVILYIRRFLSSAASWIARRCRSCRDVACYVSPFL